MSQGERCTRLYSGGTAGFSLLDMLLAMALVALVVVLVQPLARGTTRDRLLDGTTRDVASRLRATRLDAIRTNTEASFMIDVAGRAYDTAGPSPRRLLPVGLEIDATVSAADAVNSAAVKIRFYPDGSASGGSVRLRDGARSSRIVVEWLTGHVRVERGVAP